MSTNTEPEIRPVHSDPEYVGRTPCDEYCDPECGHHAPSAGWDLSFGSRINFHPVAANDDRLVVNLNLSDDAIANRSVYRQVTREQVLDHAHGLLALVDAEPVVAWSAVEAWIRRVRDAYPGDPNPGWVALNSLLDDFRDHAAMGTPLDRPVTYHESEDGESR